MPVTERVEFISVHIDPESLPEPGFCLLCSSPMQEVNLEYKFRDKPVTIKNTEPVPGYRCQVCHAEYEDSSVGLVLDKETLNHLPPQSKLRAPLEQRIAALGKALIKQDPKQ